MLTLIKDVMAVKDGLITRTDLWIDGDTIAAADARTPGRVIEGSGLTAIPGFIDTHIHGIGGQGTEDGTAEAILTMSEELAKEGVTTFFPTIYTDTMERILNDERAIVEAKGKERGAIIGGIHVEGPFIAPRKIGAQNPLGRQDPSLETFSAIISAGRGLVKAMTCAPELPVPHHRERSFPRLPTSEARHDIPAAPGPAPHTDNILPSFPALSSGQRPPALPLPSGSAP